MSDEKIIDFKNLQEKIKDSDLDKFEKYIYNMYDEVVSGKVSMFEFSSKIADYMKENNISEEKFVNMQKKLMQRYGLDPDTMEEEMERINKTVTGERVFKGSEEAIGLDAIKTGRKINFYERHKDDIKEKKILEYTLKTDKNDVKILLERNQITLISEQKIDLSDQEINLLIADYRETTNEKIKILICEASNSYFYY
ncbi:DUF3867 family protein [Peptostreptococcus faecalis]|uniref:DUF3867 family protein n=1 Tax=Peptostreptococcus faecalis TaxID=2045015 RepID=UPI000C7A2D51|nr:DUF3867 family protein [Peptostreptococcus faecalis]